MIKISLLHATRNRPRRAVATRDLFFERAKFKDNIEHIFGFDSDEHSESKKILKEYNHIEIENPNGCVKAWNELASVCTGDILVQLSDDWSPPQNWDELIINAFNNSGKNIKEFPLCLHISDGHRTDKLMCMAILNRRRYENQIDEKGDQYMFHPAYFGVYSDTEYSLKAYKDNVVIEATDIVFTHEHPFFGLSPLDNTYMRQNDKKRYLEGRRIFFNRNKELINE